MRALIIAAALLACAVAGRVSYDGDKVYRVTVDTDKEFFRLADAVENLPLDSWHELRALGQIDVRVPKRLDAVFQSLNFTTEILHENVQALIDEEERRLASRSADADWFDEYHTFEEIDQWLTDLTNQYPAITEKITIGTTYEGRSIVGLRVRSGSPRKAIVYNGGQHAREWISPPTVQGILYNLLTGYNVDPNITEYVNNIEWTLIPVLNPDGYSYTWTNDRLWRKNRQPNQGSICTGTDTNRNWGYKWATGGSSSNACSDTYHGPSPLSSAEASSIDKYIRERQAAGLNVLGYIDFHAYGQLWMNPWGHTCNEYTPDETIQQALNSECATAIRNAGYNTVYTTGPVCKTIYQASGGSNDHTYGELGVLFSIAVEGRDNGRYGFQLPASQIKPSIEETWEAIKVMARYVLEQ